MKLKKSKGQISETYFIGSVLAVAGGYFDAYTYAARGHVFANAQTGNMVLMGISVLSGDFLQALSYFLPIFAFVAGIVICEILKKYCNRFHIHWRQYVIFMEMAVTLIVGFLPQGRLGGIDFDMVANISISFVCSLQVQSFRKIRGIVCATTMCTGNLRSGTDCLVRYFSEKEKKLLRTAGKYYGIVGFFILGALISSYVTGILGEKSVMLCAVALAVVLLLMFIEPEKNIE